MHLLKTQTVSQTSSLDASFDVEDKIVENAKEWSLPNNENIVFRLKSVS